MHNNYFIVHGSYGRPFENWFPWLESKLLDRNYIVYVPQFPANEEFQNYINWEKILKAYLDVGLINENTVFIGHSLAPIFIIKFILSNNIKVAGIISVSGFNDFIGIEEFDKVNKTFFVSYNKIAGIQKHAGFIKCVYGDNDKYVPQEELEKFANSIKTEKYIIKNGGHLNTEAGYREFNKLLNIIEEENNATNSNEK